MTNCTRETTLRQIKKVSLNSLSEKKKCYKKNLKRLRNSIPKPEKLAENEYEIRTYEMALAIIKKRQRKAMIECVEHAVFIVLGSIVVIALSLMLLYFLMVRVIVPYWSIVWFTTLHAAYLVFAALWIRMCIEYERDAVTYSIIGLGCSILWFVLGMFSVACWREEHKDRYYDSKLDRFIVTYPVMGWYFYVFLINCLLVSLGFIALIIYTLARKMYREM